MRLGADLPLLKTHKAKMIEANLLDCCDRLTDAMSMQAMDRRAIEELGLPGLLLMENALGLSQTGWNNAIQTPENLCLLWKR